MRPVTVYEAIDGSRYPTAEAAEARDRELSQEEPERSVTAYIFTVVVIDREEYGLDEVKLLLENTRYISPTIHATEAVDIGPWSDDHPLNLVATDTLAWLHARKGKT